MAAQAIARGGLIHTFGTGHSHMVAEEIVYRAGGLAPVNAILEPSLTGDTQVIKSEYTERMEGWGKIIVDYHQVGKDDVMIVISNSGRNGAPIEVAWECQKRGVPARDDKDLARMIRQGQFSIWTNPERISAINQDIAAKAKKLPELLRTGMTTRDALRAAGIRGYLSYAVDNNYDILFPTGA